jgi:outer membrane biosynthesis protein TonB
MQRGRRRRLVVLRGSLADAEPPFAAVERLDGGRHGTRHLIALLVALFVHAAMGGAAAVQHVAAAHPATAAHPQIVATLQRQAPPAPPPPPPEPPRPKAPAQARAPRAPAKGPPPAPAQAGRVIAQAPSPSGPADLTGFDLVVGQGESYAGGYSSAKGTSREAVADPSATAGGVPDAPPRSPDLSRPASPLRRDWACAWPDQAQDSDLRDARATIRVSVGEDGAPAKVEVLSAPPGGFADAARRCAEREQYHAAFDSLGRPIAGTTNLFNVHFLR